MMAKMVGWGEEQTTFYVDKNNPAASDANPGTISLPWLTIQHAVNTVQRGDTIKVAQGIYSENIVLPQTLGLSLFGGYESGDFNIRNTGFFETKISGTNSSPVVLIEYSGGFGDFQLYEIDGFTIENGQQGIKAESWGNGGNASLKISDNIIQNNTGLTGSNDYGGGIHTDGLIPEIKNNTIRDNRCGKGGGLYVGFRNSENSFLIEGNTIEYNMIYADHGGGAYVSAYRGLIRNNIFRYNYILESYGWGGGLIVDGNQFAGFDDVVFIELTGNVYNGNQAPSCGSGVFIDEGANVRMKNELISGNVCTGSNKNGALYVDGLRANGNAKTILENCTVADNTGGNDSYGHAIFVEGGSEVIANNSIFYGNQCPDNQNDFYVEAASSLIVDYSIFMSGKLGDGAFSMANSLQADPLFADNTYGDYHLKSKGGRWNNDLEQWIVDTVHSPGIDAGDPVSDFSNEPLPNGDRINLGCFGNTIQASKSKLATYQVGPTRLFHTLQEVAGLLNPGDVVEVDGDYTYPGGVAFSRPGTGTEKITIRGIRINGRRPLISGGVNTVAFFTPWPYTGPEGAHHYVFEGFEITGATNRGIFHQAQDLTIRDCLIHDFPGMGILGADQGSGSLLVEYTEVYGCGYDGGIHQIYVATDEVNNPGSVFRMQHCYIHDANGGNNIKSRAERNEIYYNWIEGAFYHELELIGPEWDACGGDQELAREDSDVVGNVLIKKQTAAGNDPNFSVVRIGGDGTGESFGRYRFLNNTIICGTGSVFRMYDALESVEIQNNVFYNPTGNVLFKRTMEANWVTGQEVISGANNWTKTGTGELPVQLSGTILGDNPGFVYFAGENFFPSANSALINAGVLPTVSLPGFEFPNPLPQPLKLPPNGAIESVYAADNRITIGNIDIGAFEFQGGIPFYSVSPTTINFGTVFIGESQTRQITITNESEVPIVVDNIEVQPGIFQIPVFNFPIEITDNLTFDIIFEPLETQNYTGTLTISSSQTSDTEIPLTGNGALEPSGGVHVSGELTGLWAGWDTLFVDGNIIVPLGETLEIMPGNGNVDVIFTGPFSITVYGRLLLTGNETDSITMYAENAETGWEGIRFINTSGNNQGNSEIHFCLLKDGKSSPETYRSGGAIQADYSSNLIITNCIFLNNEATNGGAIYLDFSSPSISDCEISFNTASESGGGIYLGYDCNPTLSNLNIHHNSALTGNGGGVYILYGSAPNFQNSSVKSNVGYSGGGIACSSDLAVFSYLDISGNTANGEWANGGGISCSANPLISHCTIKGNISIGSGGGISCNYENSPHIEYCEIDDNHAASGGGIACLYSSNPNIKHTFFSNNLALNGNGGGMYNWAGSNPELSFVSFESNSSSDEGGAIYIQDSDGKFTNLTIKNNQATNKGGGIFIRGTSSPEFYNALVCGNSAEWGGGIIAFENPGTPVFHNATISGNSAWTGGGGLACDFGNPEFYSSVFWGNFADDFGNNVYLHVTESDPYFNYCIIENGTAGFGGAGSGYNYDNSRYNNNLGENPQFSNPAGSDFNLLVSSPAINHGLYDTTGFNLPTTDLNGNPRISAFLLDIGCYENQEFIAPQQTLSLPSGWSGISSYLLPYFPQLEKMFEAAAENLIILQNQEGFYWPSQNINMLGNWNTEKGYLIKLSDETNLTIPGIVLENTMINLPSGWSLIPVLNSCGLQTDELILQLGSELIFIKEAAGVKVYWPEMGVQSLTGLMPGNSYFIFLNEPALLTFPACAK
jgi:parallel beta-helix repeat protein/predicted outer membrane repeat protein